MSNQTVRQTDVVVIGAGPGGYTAAFAAADLGLQVVLVDAGEQPGGVCLNHGCIPSKTLLHIAKLINETRDAQNFGVTWPEPQIDLDTLRNWKNQVITRNANGIRQLAKARNVELIRAWARFENPNTLALSSQQDGEPDLGRIEFQRAVIATGSRPMIPDALNMDSPYVWNSSDALALPDIPKTLVVVGGGYIGLELGTVYAALGSEVTCVEMTDGLLPGIDRDLVRILQMRLRKTFANIYLQTQVISAADTGQRVSVHFQTTGSAGPGKSTQPAQQEFDRVLVAVGRQPNSGGLGLENTKVTTNQNGFIEVNQKLQTHEGSIYAIGDVIAGPMLAHKASYEARAIAEILAGKSAQAEPRHIPAVVFTDPEIARVGLTETEAKEAGLDITVAKFPWGASGRASSIGRNDGVTKIIANSSTKQVLGVDIIGVGASELIAEAVLAIESNATRDTLRRCIHPHPTLSETIFECAELVFGTTTHQAPRQK